MTSNAQESTANRQSAKQSDGRIFFPWLTEVRFLAAMMVFVTHTLYMFPLEGLASEKTSFLQTLGNHGVRLFFVLSGFLITSLLIKEQQQTGTVKIKKFYTRRALRIWPLYYTLLLVAFLVPTSWIIVKPDSIIAQMAAVKFDHLNLKLALFIFLLPNLALTLFDPIPGFAQSWSIGVEEQFYLLWPALFRYFSKNTLFSLMGVIVVKIVAVLSIESFLLEVTHKTVLVEPQYQWAEYLLKYLNYLQIEAMAIGGLGAYFFANYPKQIENFVSNNWFRITLIVGIAFSVTSNWLKIHELLICNLIWLGFLLSLTTSKMRLPRRLQQPLNYLGKISYGLYMIHPLVDFLVIKGFSLVSTHVTTTYAVAYFITALSATILISAISYELLERKFLLIKKSFEVVKSSPSEPV